MKKIIKTNDILAAFNIINAAKYTSLEDKDKVKVWKIARALKPVATKFKEDTEDAAEKLKPEVDGGYDEMFMKAQEFERIQKDPKADKTKLPITTAEYGEFIEKFQKYQKLLFDALKEFSEKDVELEFEPLDDDGFGKLMASNEWTMDQVLALTDIICE